MNETDIRNYAGLMQELGLTALEITENGKAVRLERTFSSSPSVLIPENLPASLPSAPPAASGKDILSVTSSIVGVFYAAPAENAAPYVAIGDSVKKGQVLCVVEAMKLMNEMTAEEDGVISEICVTNGQVVEYGTELFRIRKER